MNCSAGSETRRKFFALLCAILIFYCATAWIQLNVSSENFSPAASESSETSESEKEKTAELKPDDLVSQEDKFVFGYDLETALYGDSAEWILVQHFSEIENPPPEKLRFSI
ncbi:hypothetical protein [Leptospira weilii]|nr:hypothetical protein [Leptospira weilii]